MIYVISKGEYSDYRILGVTTDKEKAERYALIRCAGVEEHEELGQVIPATYFLWNVRANLDGTICQKKGFDYYGIERVDNEEAGTDEVSPSYYFGQYLQEPSKDLGWKFRRKKLYAFCTYVWAKDEKHVAKVWSERYRALMAGSIYLWNRGGYADTSPVWQMVDGKWVMIGNRKDMSDPKQ